MAKKKNILILGATGMLGSMVFKYFFKKPTFNTFGTVRQISGTKNLNKNSLFIFNANDNINPQLDRLSELFQPDYVINCIGVINKHCRDNDPVGIKNAIRINALFPYELSDYYKIKFPDAKIIQIATDCVFSGQSGNYSERSVHDALDVYGKTQSLGEVIAPNFLNIRTSLIGPEEKNKISLLEWFLSHPNHSIIKGYSHHIWNGVTTLQYAQYCKEIINGRMFNKLLEKNNTIHYCPNSTVTKYQLLNIFQDVFHTNFIIEEDNSIGEPIDRSLTSCFQNFPKKEIKIAILKLKKFMDLYY